MITRDVYVCRNAFMQPVEYPQGTNAVPLVFYFRDFTIPDGAEAAIYMEKPSGAEVYNSGSISGSTVAFDITTQMSAESGRMAATVHIYWETGSDDGSTTTVLNTFDVPVIVLPTNVSDSAIESKDEFTALDALVTAAKEAAAVAEKALEKANAAITAADTAAGIANTAAAAANTAASNANSTATEVLSKTEKVVTAAETATSAANEAQEAINRVNEILDNLENIINDETASASTTYSSEYINGQLEAIRAALGTAISTGSEKTGS